MTVQELIDAAIRLKDENDQLKREVAKLRYKLEKTQNDREELDRHRKEAAQRELEERCKLHGHKWFQHPYCGAGDRTYSTCTRCGAETTD